MKIKIILAYGKIQEFDLPSIVLHRFGPYKSEKKTSRKNSQGGARLKVMSPQDSPDPGRQLAWNDPISQDNSDQFEEKGQGDGKPLEEWHLHEEFQTSMNINL